MHHATHLDISILLITLRPYFRNKEDSKIDCVSLCFVDDWVLSVAKSCYVIEGKPLSATGILGGISVNVRTDFKFKTAMCL